MPLYEYRCNACRKRTTVLTRGFSETPNPVCEHCGATELTRLISQFAVRRSLGDADDVPDDAFANVDEGDPHEMTDWMRRMKGQLGETSEEYDEIMADMESGTHDDGGEGGSGDGGGLEE